MTADARADAFALDILEFSAPLSAPRYQYSVLLPFCSAAVLFGRTTRPNYSADSAASAEPTVAGTSSSSNLSGHSASRIGCHSGSRP